MAKKIVFTGGGTAGHVTPNLALFPEFIKNEWQISYIGSYRGIERELIEKTGIPYYPVSSGKLRRYLDFKNFLDPFKVIKGVIQAYFILGRLKPSVVFSKGGFVSVPVVIASRLRGIPAVLHESDFTPGLANKIAIPFAEKVCVSFPETMKYLPKNKAVYTGSPVRRELLDGDREKGLKICGFDRNRPVLMVMGGSLGAGRINKAIRDILPDLLQSFQVAHICGKGNVDGTLRLEGYRQFEYIHEELPHIFAAADLVVSRAGANAVFELLALRKPNILIPLSREASRGDQILNAASFANAGYSMVMDESELDGGNLLRALLKLWQEKDKYTAAMAKNSSKDGIDEIFRIINQVIA